MHMHKLWALAGVICTVMFSSLLLAPIVYADAPKELWSFSAPSTTNKVYWQSGLVADGIAYVWNTETYSIPSEQEDYLSYFPHYPQFVSSLLHSLGNIHALNAQNGSELWNCTVTGIIGLLSVSDGVVYVSASDGLMIDGKYGGGGVHAFDAATGAQKWEYKIDGDIMSCSINNGMIYVFFHASSPGGSFLCAVNATDGQELWRWKAGSYVFPSKFAYSDEAIYLGTNYQYDNHYYGINKTDGSLLWNTPIDGARALEYYSTFGDGVVYFWSTKDTYALDSQNGNQLWNYSAAAGYSISNNGILYNKAGDNVYAYDGLKGKQIWNYSANGRTILSLCSIDNVVYFSTNGTLEALNAANGAPLWSSSTDVNGTLRISDGSLRYYGFDTYGSVNDGVFYFFSGKTIHILDLFNGSRLWNYTIGSDQTFDAFADNVAFFEDNKSIHALSFPAVLHPSPSPTMGSNGISVNLESLSQILIIGLIVATIVSLTIVLLKKRARK
jgi:outer membrane protein assembly factor BamB